MKSIESENFDVYILGIGNFLNLPIKFLINNKYEKNKTLSTKFLVLLNNFSSSEIISKLLLIN